MSAYFVAPDGYDDPTIWRHNPDRPDFPEALMVRTGANAEAFTLLAGYIEREAALVELRDDLLSFNPFHGDYRGAGKRLRDVMRESS